MGCNFLWTLIGGRGVLQAKQIREFFIQHFFTIFFLRATPGPSVSNKESFTVSQIDTDNQIVRQIQTGMGVCFLCLFVFKISKRLNRSDPNYMWDLT